MSDDSELLRRYAGDCSQDAFAELVQRHLTLVYSTALRQVGGDAHLAQDVTQKVFIDLARKAAVLAQRPMLAGWLHTSTRFAAAKVVRAERRRQAREEKAHIMEEILRDSDSSLDWERVRPVLDDALGELGELDREAVLLRYFEGQPLAAVGVRLAVTETAARSRVDRALDKLRAVLARRGVTSTSAALGVALANQASVAAPAGLAASITGAALAGVAGGGAVGLFTFMSTTKVIAGIAAGVVLFAVGSTVFEFKAVQASDAALTSASNERVELRARLAAMEKRAMQAEAGGAAMRAELDNLRTNAAKTATAGAAHATGPFEYVLDHPEARPAFLQHAALTAKIRFERFFQTVGLTGEQQDKFLKLIMDDAESRLEVFAMRRAAGGLDPGVAMNPDAIGRMSAVAARNDTEIGNGMRELLGDRAKPLMHEYLRTLSERNVADQLAGQLYYTDAPLTADQADRLVQVLAQNQHNAGPPVTARSTMGGTVIPREWVNNVTATLIPATQNLPWTQDSPVTDAAVAQAAAVLTPTQLTALKLLQARQAADLQLVPPTRSKADGPRGDTQANK